MSRTEIVAGAAVVVVLAILVGIEPDIVEAPVASSTATAATVGGLVLGAAALAALVRLGCPPALRVAVLGVPFVAVTWWLVSPYFVDDVVDEAFVTSIADARSPAATTGGSGAPAGAPGDDAPTSSSTTTPGPTLLGAGTFVGLAGHDGMGDAGIFRDVDGSLVLRFERFDIENGPDLEVYLVPGADQTDLVAGSIHLGPLKGNVGDQGYVLPAGADLPPGAYTALVWCDAFDVEFVGATIAVA